MLFGTQKPRGLFGGQMPMQHPMPQSGQDMTPTAMPAPQGMFGGQQSMAQPAPSNGVNWGGVIADALAGAAGREPAFLNSVMAGREQERAAQAAEANRAASMQDWRTKFDYEQEHQKPVNNDTVNDFNWYKGLSEPDRATYDQFRPVTMMTPEGPILVPRSTLGGSPAQPSGLPPVGSVIPDPRKGGAGGKPAGGGFPINANGFVPPPTLAGGHMTSGRRTVEGNRAVGGVENSPHLSGASADYAGPDLQAILEQARKFPGIKRAFIHNAGSGKHVHTEGDGWNTPYYGKNGTRGR